MASIRMGSTSGATFARLGANVVTCITPGLEGVVQGTAAWCAARLKHQHDWAAVPRAHPSR